MGKIYKNGVPYGGGGSGSGGSGVSFSGSASDVTYNNTGTELESKNVQDAVTEVAVKIVECGSLIEGMIIPVTTGGWVLDGTLYKYIISMESLTGDELLNVDLYNDGTVTDEQIYAFDMLVSYAESKEGQIVLYATEAIGVDFSIIIRGNIRVENPQIIDFATVKKEVEELKTQMETGRQYACVNEAVGESIYIEDAVSGNMIISDAGVNVLPFDLEYIKSINAESDTNLGTWADNVYTKDGISFTLNGDGSITINGTNSSGTTAIFMTLISKYIGFDGEYYCGIGLTSNKGVRLKIEQLDGTGVALYNVYTETFVELKSDIEYRFSIGIDSNATMDNVTIYPMLSKGRIPRKYVPYEGYDIVSCGKNLLNNIATSKTANGVTFTVNSDGSITANGTSTAVTYCVVANWNSDDLVLDVGKYIFSGCPTGGGNKTYALGSADHNNSNFIMEYGDGSEINMTEKNNRGVYIAVFAGVTVNNLTFYPMIQRADIADNTYDPYKESRVTINKDTQFPVTGLKSFDGVTNILNIYDTEMTVQYALNKTGTALLHCNNEFWLSTTIPAGETEVTITNSSIKEDTICDIYCDNSNASGDITSLTNGSIIITLGSALDVDVIVKVKGVNL